MARRSFRLSRSSKRLGEHLAGWRKVHNLPASLVAERAGISRTTLTRIEAGDEGVKLANVLAVMDALGVLDRTIEALDPLNDTLGLARAHMLNRKRVR